MIFFYDFKRKNKSEIKTEMRRKEKKKEVCPVLRTCYQKFSIHLQIAIAALLRFSYSCQTISRMQIKSNKNKNNSHNRLHTNPNKQFNDNLQPMKVHCKKQIT